jgi:glycosyltransferase involved in cell wall biosynthesis
MAAEKLNDQGNLGGWIASLEKEVAKIEGIQLGVAFHYGNQREHKFEIGSTKYFPIPYPKTKKKLRGFFFRWNHTIEPDNVTEDYVKIINDFSPDIIQVFGTESPFGMLIPLINIPTIIHIQGNLIVCNYKWYSGISSFDVLRYSRYKELLKGFGLFHLKFLFSKRANRELKIMNDAKYYIGRTDWDRRICKVLSPDSTYFHCEELLREEFYKTEPWKKPEAKKIRIVSLISPMIYKGLETVLVAISILKGNKNYEFEWNIIGMRGTEEIVSIIEKTKRMAFHNFNINFKGSLEPNKVIAELLNSHLYVHPSHIENSPNSVCEAMLLGMPVIATYSGGTPSIVTNGFDGLLIQDGDPWSLSGAILELVKDDQMVINLANNARKKALLRHDKTKIRNRIIEIYKKILEENRNSFLSK